MPVSFEGLQENSSGHASSSLPGLPEGLTWRILPPVQAGDAGRDADAQLQDGWNGRLFHCPFPSILILLSLKGDSALKSTWMDGHGLVTGRGPYRLPQGRAGGGWGNQDCGQRGAPS